MDQKIKVLFLAAEAEPYIKVGGLADVAGSLPLALREIHNSTNNIGEFDVRLVLPLHPSINTGAINLCPLVNFKLSDGSVDRQVKVYETFLDGMPVYFIQGEPLSNSLSVYSADLASDRKKYAFFSIAALAMTRAINWRPDIVHANDWHTAISLYAIATKREDPWVTGTRTVLTVHNLPFMGGDGADVLSEYKMPPLSEETLPAWALTQPLPLGLWAADAIIPVSPTYAREILTSGFGCGLETYLKSKSTKITGILNGLDIKSWNPETDQTLPANFSTEDISNRVNNKICLQQELQLKEDSTVPLLAMIGRIDRQKGIDIAFSALRMMADLGWQFVLLGSGDPTLEKEASDFQTEFQDRVRAVIRYDARLSRLLYGGCDIFLMPSRYEPCGLAQMIAMRYGSVPVVHATGGLIDTVQEGETGFDFVNPESQAMKEAIERAFHLFSDPGKWRKIQRNGMGTDHSWASSAYQYATIYQSLISGS